MNLCVAGGWSLTLLIIFYSLVFTCTCKHCGKKFKGWDYEGHIASCPDLPIECMFECGKYIARKMIKQHCQQCNNAKKILLQDDVTCSAIQESSAD